MERKIYAFDLDWTLCTGKPREWECTPIQYRIDRVNDLYKKWQVILIYTARHPEYYQDTLAWLIKHWVYFHWLNMWRKPWADFYIDDKAISDKDFFNIKIWK
jgi:hypothetical protein